MTVKSFCKRFSFLAFSLCLMIVTGLVSCDNSTLKKEQVDNEFENQTAYISIGKITVAEEGRTVLPSFGEGSLDTFYFFLKGKKTSESGDLQPLSSTSGVFLNELSSTQFAVSLGEWIFELTADYNGTVFTGTVTKNIQAVAEEIDFSLKLNQEQCASSDGYLGSLSFTLNFPDPDNKVKYVTGQLYNYSSGTETTNSSYPETDLTYTAGSGTITYSLTNVSSGTYSLKIRLYANEATDESSKNQYLINTWPELVIILYGKESSATRTISSLNEVYQINWYNIEGINESLTFPQAYTRLSETYTLPDSTEITKDGYTFGGWFANEGCTGDPVTSIQKGTTGIQDLYAKWIARDDIKYYIYSYFQPLDGRTNLDDYQEDSTLAPRSYKIGTTGHTTNETADLIEGFESQPITQETIAPDESTIVKIYYDRKRYSVTFVPNGNISVESQTVLYQGTATEPSPAPSRSPYTFEGWYTSTDGGTTLSSTAYDFTTSVTANITLYAKWTPPSGTPTGFVYVIGGTVTGAITNSTIFTAYGGSKTIPNMYVCDHEVTQAEYETYCKYKDASTGPSSLYGDGDNYATYDTNWYDAIVYCNIRSMKEGLFPVYQIAGSYDPADWPNIGTSGSGDETKYGAAISGSNDETWDAVKCNPNANGYRLPTSAEWEYIARGGENGIPETQYDYSGSNTLADVAWYSGNSESKIHEVKTRAPNSLGIYDMSGNVMEWCWDADYSGMRELRGGHYSHDASSCTVYDSGYNDPGMCIRGGGFRVIRYMPEYVGTKPYPTEIGDIVFNDGSATPYTGSGLSPEQDEAVISIIFYAGNELNNSGDTSKRVLGISLYKSEDAKIWGPDSWGQGTNSTDLDVYFTMNNGCNTEFTEDSYKDGRNMLAQIKAAITAAGHDDDTNDASKYPQFYFGINYKNIASNIIDTEYEDGWYCPTICELCYIGRAYNNNDLGGMLETIVGEDYFSDTIFWASNLLKPTSNSNKYCYDFTGSGSFTSKMYDQTNYSLAIRQFN